jgi:hypothetical protein
MPVSAHLVRAGTLLCALLLWGAGLTPAGAAPLVAPQAVPAEAVQVAPDGALRLAPNAPPAPAVFGAYTHWGTLTAAPQSLAVFRALRVAYTADVPANAALLVDVRASADGLRWTPWQTELPNGAEVEFGTAARYAQYRVTLLGGASPVVHAVSLAPVARPARYAAFEEAAPVAPTFTVRGTRQGMVGGRTANGHRIQKRDRFVALPCTCVLSSKGGNEYMVRITYKGHSVVVPVYDVGPWNTKDNYWDPQEQRRFSDLRQGWPQDHAAFFDRHNDGRDASGRRVRFPTAIDVGDGIWWDEFGIKGDRAELEVTFLWMGRDPHEAPPAPAPEAAPEAVPAPAP